MPEATINVLDISEAEDTRPRGPELEPTKRSSNTIASALEAFVFVGGARAHPHRLDVLLVDDRPELVAMFRRLVERWGHRVRVASCGSSGLELSREAPPAVVFVRDRLADMDGADLARLLRGCGIGARLFALAHREGPEGGGREVPVRQGGPAFESILFVPLEIELLESVLAKPPPPMVVARGWEASSAPPR